jgi:hypothetical protein
MTVTRVDRAYWLVARGLYLVFGTSLVMAVRTYRRYRLR